MIIVKLAELNAQTVEYSLESGSTVGDLFDIAKKTFVEGAVRINQSVVDEETPLRDGDRVFNGKATKGNMDSFDVSFAKLGDSVVTVSAQPGQTIRQILESGLNETDRARFFTAEGKSAFEYRLQDGRTVPETHVLTTPAEGDRIRIICSQMVKGNK